jgi:hypothetical protein
LVDNQDEEEAFEDANQEETDAQDEEEAWIPVTRTRSGRVSKAKTRFTDMTGAVAAHMKAMYRVMNYCLNTAVRRWNYIRTTYVQRTHTQTTRCCISSSRNLSSALSDSS